MVPQLPMEPLQLTPSLVSTFDVAAVHRQHQKSVSCLDFSRDGKTLVSSSGDETIVVYNCLEGGIASTIPVKKYGAGVLRFVQDHQPATLVTASTIGDHHIRALDIDSQRYIRYYDGHESRVVSISSSPVSSQFISSSQDSYVRVWDCRKRNAAGKVCASGTPIVSYDPKGLIFGIAFDAPNLRTLVKLYDTRNYQSGPFMEFSLENPSDSTPTCFKFSSDGEYFLVVDADVNASVTMYDAYKGFAVRTFSGHRNASGMPLEASFSPDSGFVASGSDDGSVFLWDLKTGRTLVGQSEVHAMPSSCIQWNPVYTMVASACQNVLFWLPSEEQTDEVASTDA